MALEIVTFVSALVIAMLAVLRYVVGLKGDQKKAEIIDAEWQVKTRLNSKEVGGDRIFDLTVKGLDPDQPHLSRKIPISYRIYKRKQKRALFFCSGLGLDHSDFTHLSNEYPDFDLVFVTLPGFEIERPSDSVKLSFDSASYIYQQFVTSFSNRGGYDTVALIGFSVGADILVKSISEGKIASPVTGLVLLDPNIGPQTLFISKFIAGFQSSEMKLPDLKKVLAASEFRSLESWANTHEYFVKIVRKFSGRRIHGLAEFAGAVCQEFDQLSPQDVASRVSLATQRDLKCSVIFSRDAPVPEVSHVFNVLSPKQFSTVHHIGLDHFDLIGDPQVIGDSLQHLFEARLPVPSVSLFARFWIAIRGGKGEV